MTNKHSEIKYTSIVLTKGYPLGAFFDVWPTVGCLLVQGDRHRFPWSGGSVGQHVRPATRRDAGDGV